MKIRCNIYSVYYCALCLLWGALPNHAYSQETAVTNLYIYYDTEIESTQVFRLQNNEVDLFLNQLKDSLQQQGFLEAGVDTILKSDNNWYVYMHLGEKIEKIWVSTDEETIRILNSQGFTEASLGVILYDAQKIQSIFKRLVVHWENNGHPFVSVSLGNLHVTSTGLHGNIEVNKGPTIYFDTIEVVGNAKVSASFLGALTEIKPGNLYSEKLVKQLDQRLSTISFVRLTQSSAILFMDNKAKPIVYLANRNNDVIDGIIGMAPAASGGVTPNQQFLLTGEIRMRFSNIGRGGQSLEMNWRSFNERSQELKIGSELPFLFGSNFGTELGFNSVKFDTLFSQFQGKIALAYHFNGTNKVKFYMQRQGTTLITVDSTRIRATGNLPSNQSMSIINYGINLSLSKLNYIFNPSKGYKLDIIGGVGTKNIRRDNRIENIKITAIGGESYSIYDSIQLKMFQYNYAFNFEKYSALGKQSTLKTALSGESLFAPAIYFNELIRFGGIYSLRGFNEQSLFASSYTMLTVEYRYLTGPNSNLFLFWNGAYYQDRSVVRATTLQDFPYGFGAGANLETGAGILTLAYAVGSENDNPIRFQAGKIHFGFTGLF